ncbi:MAG: CDGSH iron-sulfur domain-containing protein [Hyphomicrobiales bacterium]|nr:CDGSH iron-sulfur domain-containing protein [Hyphomicrobiales bacterium]
MGNANVAGKAPIAVEVEAGKNYFWCSCGHSANQPFCDGSHKTTDFKPVKWECKEDGKKFFCACKQTSGQPFCDGSHKDL